jgi:KaiC/GvpD/RAD55 family RecA-like ATPase
MKAITPDYSERDEHKPPSLESLSIGANWASFHSFRKQKLSGMETGIDGLDRSLLGLHGITTLQGEPAACKSSLCLQIAGNVARKGHPVLMVDRENGLQRLRLRLTCQVNEVSQVDVLTGEDRVVEGWAGKIRQLPIYVLTEPPREAEQLLPYLRALYKQYKKPVLLVVDSLQALPKIKDDERLNIQYWMEFLDQVKLSAEGKVYILMTSEKRRGAYDEASMDGGKGSNAIEYKSEVLLDLRKDMKSGRIILQCKKFRDGLADFRIEFRKKLADPSEDQSFCFKLEECEGEEI